MKNPKSTKELRRELRQRNTKAERILWFKLRNCKCDGYKFKRQFGIEPYILDFFCAEAGLVIELDGPIHDLPLNRLHDRNKDVFLNENGVEVMRIKNECITENIEETLTHIKLKLSNLTIPSPCEGDG